jgi:hypothetical protein
MLIDEQRDEQRIVRRLPHRVRVAFRVTRAVADRDASKSFRYVRSSE